MCRVASGPPAPLRKSCSLHLCARVLPTKAAVRGGARHTSPFADVLVAGFFYGCIYERAQEDSSKETAPPMIVHFGDCVPGKEAIDRMKEVRRMQTEAQSAVGEIEALLERIAGHVNADGQASESGHDPEGEHAQLRHLIVTHYAYLPLPLRERAQAALKVVGMQVDTVLHAETLLAKAVLGPEDVQRLRALLNAGQGGYDEALRRRMRDKLFVQMRVVMQLALSLRRARARLRLQTQKAIDNTMALFDGNVVSGFRHVPRRRPGGLTAADVGKVLSEVRHDSIEVGGERRHVKWPKRSYRNASEGTAKHLGMGEGMGMADACLPRIKGEVAMVQSPHAGGLVALRGESLRNPLCVDPALTNADRGKRVAIDANGEIRVDGKLRKVRWDAGARHEAFTGELISAVDAPSGKVLLRSRFKNPRVFSSRGGAIPSMPAFVGADQLKWLKLAAIEQHRQAPARPGATQPRPGAMERVVRVVIDEKERCSVKWDAEAPFQPPLPPHQQQAPFQIESVEETVGGWVVVTHVFQNPSAQRATFRQADVGRYFAVGPRTIRLWSGNAADEQQEAAPWARTKGEEGEREVRHVEWRGEALPWPWSPSNFGGWWPGFAHYFVAAVGPGGVGGEVVLALHGVFENPASDEGAVTAADVGSRVTITTSGLHANTITLHRDWHTAPPPEQHSHSTSMGSKAEITRRVLWRDASRRALKHDAIIRAMIVAVEPKVGGKVRVEGGEHWDGEDRVRDSVGHYFDNPQLRTQEAYERVDLEHAKATMVSAVTKCRSTPWLVAKEDLRRAEALLKEIEQAQAEQRGDVHRMTAEQVGSLHSNARPRSVAAGATARRASVYKLQGGNGSGPAPETLPSLNPTAAA